MKKAALLSVSDRTGLIPFAKSLQELGYALLSTSGTGKALQEAGIETLSVEQYTGQKEILGGRVKTLHPKLYAGILYRRGLASDEADIENDNIFPIDVVAVNLYPFSKLQAERGSDHAAMTELIDIGGPSMIRAAAKNHKFVLPVIDPADYVTTIEYLKSGTDDFAFRRKLSAKVLLTLAADAGDVAAYLAEDPTELSTFASSINLKNSRFERSFKRPVTAKVQSSVLIKKQDLRYGENPHQAAGYFEVFGESNEVFKQLHGKELSYNNLLDTEAVVRIISSIETDKAVAVIVKHTNPCGVAVRDTLKDALASAKKSDPRSHFGGVLAFNKPVDIETANTIREDFAEIVVAPSFSAEALAALQVNKNIRLLEIALPQKAATEYRVALGGVLLQDPDCDSSFAVRQVSGPPITASLNEDCRLAWNLCAHVKSNAIVCVKDGMLLSVGAGQMSRIDSVELCLAKAKRHGHDVRQSVIASDAFFPFPDSVEMLGADKVAAIISPSGAKRDAETVAAAEAAGVALLFADARHFRH